MRDCLKLVIRRIRRHPFVALTVSGLLGAGIGVGAGLLTVTASILYRPLPFPESERLVQFGSSELTEGREERTEYFTHDQFLDLRRSNGLFESTAAVKEAGRGDTVYWTGAEEPLRLRAALVTPEFFRCLATPPALGRVFEDTRSGGAGEVILSQALWRSRFGASQDAIGSKLLLNGEPRVVIGVMPASLDENGAEMIHGNRIDVWLPLDARWIIPREVAYRVLARLSPGVGLAAANQALLAGWRGRDDHDGLWRNAVPQVRSLREEVVSSTRRYLYVLSVAGLLLFALTGANAAGLLLARMEPRRMECAIQTALGARPGRLAAEAVCESIFLTLGAFLVACASSLATVALFRRLAPLGVPRLSEVSWGGESLQGVGLLSLVGVLALTVLLSRQSASPRLGALLREDGATGGLAESRFRRMAILLETAAAVALLFSASLLFQSFSRLSSTDPGFRGSGVLLFDIFIPDFNLRDGRRGQAPVMYETIRERVSALPSVLDVAFTSSPPLAERDYYSSGGFRVRRVDHRYFELLGTPLLEGRGLDAVATGRKEAVISTALAKRLFPDRSPLGAQVDGYEIVGVVADVRHASLDAEPEPAIYVSCLEEPDTRLSMLVRTNGSYPGLANLIRSRIWQVYPEQPVAGGAELEELARQSAALVYRRLFLALLGGFSLAALVLSATGFYALIAQFVDRQSKKLGIRMVLGAAPRDILILTLSQTWRLVWVGSLVGVAGTFWFSELQRNLLFETSPYDFATLLLVLFVVFLVATGGSSIPASRAAKLHPAEILRVG